MIDRTERIDKIDTIDTLFRTDKIYKNFEHAVHERMRLE